MPRPFRALLPVALAGALTALFAAAGTRALVDDGPGLLRILANASGPFPGYDHAAYLVLARAFEYVIGRGRGLDALLLASAASAALAVVLVAHAASRRSGSVVGTGVALGLLACPGTWYHAGRVELHATQLLGASLLAVVALHASERRGTVRLLLLAAAAAAAVTCHTSNLTAVPGALWIAARGAPPGPRPDRRSGVAAGAALALGAGVGLGLNALAAGPRGADFTGSILGMLERFWRGPDLAFLVDEVLAPWFPALVAAAALALLRPSVAVRGAPFLVAALPGLVFFQLFGVPTGGGYATTALPFLLLGGASMARTVDAHPPAGPARVGLVVVVCLVATLWSWRHFERLGDPLLAQLEREGDARYAAVREVAPNGAVVLGVSITAQYLDGRDARYADFDVFERLIVEFAEGRPPMRYAAELEPTMASMAANGRTLVIDQAWLDLRAIYPGLEERMDALLDTARRHYRFDERTAQGRSFLVGRSRD